MAASETDTQSQQAEIERLRREVARLEAELVAQAQRTNRIVAQAQERAYWLDRWHIDLNALMRKPGAAQLRAAMRAVRKVVRAAKKVKRKLTRS